MPGLFATAYGNVGSSIYYALGLVAAHALGLTPLVFLFAGGLFALTAKTYAEGAAMFPEAGGSSSFARHAFNEVVSFVAGWGLSLDYILTIAISAFFVPHYLGAFFPALGHAPGDVIGGIAVIALLALVNIRGLGESAKLNIALAVLDLFTQLGLVVLGAVAGPAPGTLVSQVHLGVAPSFSQLIFAVSISMLAYTGIETVSNMAEEARDPGEQVPKAVNLVLIAVLGLYAGISVIALSALPVTQNAAGHYATALGTDLRRRPGTGDRLRPRPARHPRHRRQLLRRRAGGDDPGDRDQRRDDRHLPPLLVPGRAPPAARRVRQAAPPIPHPLVHDPLLLGARGPAGAAGKHRIPRQPLQLRGDALVHDRPSLDHRAPAAPARRDRPYRAPWNVRWRDSEISADGGSRGGWYGRRIRLGDRPPSEARIIGTAWLGLGLGRLPALPSPPRASTRASWRRSAATERPLDFLEVSYKSALVPIFGTNVDGDAMTGRRRSLDPTPPSRRSTCCKIPQDHELPDRGFRRARNTRRAALSTSPDCRRGPAGSRCG